MNLKNQLITGLFALLLGISNLNAAEKCDDTQATQQTRVYYINGIRLDSDEALRSVIKLEYSLDPNVFDVGHSINYSGGWR